jgi:capsular polysaccharide transport system permease protein
MLSLEKLGNKGFAIRTLPKQSIQVARKTLEISAAVQRKIGWFGVSFLVTVVAPTVLCLLYLLLIASYQYEAEARFVVRSAETSQTNVSDQLSGLGALTAIAGVKSTVQDAFIVTDYVRSQTIIEDLGGKARLQETFAKPGIDLLSKLRASKSLEDTLYYWRRQVTASIDTQSNVITLRVLAFAPEDAKALTEQILRKSEALVNDISTRNRTDTFARAEAEVQRALQRLATMRVALLTFRTSASTIDPILSATSLGETLTLLTREKIGLEAQRQSLEKMLDNTSPTVRLLSQQIEALTRQIDDIQTRMTGRVKSLETTASQLADYEDLKLRSMFAEKLLEIAQSSLERARVDLSRQQMYIMTVVKPTMPEEARFPRPFIGTLIFFIICFVIWSMIALVLASIFDHAQ